MISKYIRPDFVFSYWIFLWFILFKLKLIQYNPKNAIMFAIAINISMLLFLIQKKSSKYNIIKFIIINTIIKIVPFILIYKSSTTKEDNYFFVFLFCIYLCWIYLNNTNNTNNKKNKQLLNVTYNELLFAYIDKNKTNINKKTPLSYYYDIIFAPS